MKKSFLKHNKPLLTVMVQAKNNIRTKALMDAAFQNGAEAFGMQFEKFEKKYRTPEIYRELFDYSRDCPVYVTNYRYGENEAKTDEELGLELIELAECGATLCDVMGDFFDKQDGEFTTDPIAIKKQEDLIQKIHNKGAEVIMSSHILTFTPASKILEIALEHQKRGADICKIVSGASTIDEEIENLRIINLLKNTLEIPFLFLCVGECDLLRRVGGELGNCMYLCVNEYDELATPAQPLLKNQKAIRDNM